MPVTITKGFSPRLKISITKALKLGVESGAEEVVFGFDKDIVPEEFVRSINNKLPEGVLVLRAEEMV